MRRRPTVAISLGDPYGIGPEVVAVALSQPALRMRLEPLVFGDARVLRRAALLRRVPLDLNALEIINPSPVPSGAFRFGHPPTGAGRFAVAYLKAAAQSVVDGRAQALCTAPIHKQLAAEAGFQYAGHTEFLAKVFGIKRAVMMLTGPRLRVALVTVHVALRDVSRLLTLDRVYETLVIVDAALKRDFAIPRPRLAVTGVNPHAGEQGLLGSEEQRVLRPAIDRAKRSGIDAEGPLAADSLFARQVRAPTFDVIVAMSHDQGLGPLKVVDFERAVNVTLGLPRPRTSPDHGVAFDIAGRGIADATSMREALLLAAKLARNSRSAMPPFPARGARPGQ